MLNWAYNQTPSHWYIQHGGQGGSQEEGWDCSRLHSGENSGMFGCRVVREVALLTAQALKIPRNLSLHSRSFEFQILHLSLSHLASFSSSMNTPFPHPYIVVN